MLGIELRQSPAGSVPASQEAQIAGSVGIVGKMTGMLYVYTSVTFARELAGVFLNLSHLERPSEELINDAVGEMTNMLGGHMKSRLVERGMPCVLTTPSVARGNPWNLEAMRLTEGRTYSFGANGARLYVRCVLKPTPTDATRN